MKHFIGSLIVGGLLMSTSCSPPHSEADCEENIERARQLVEQSAASRADRVADTLEGALDVQKNGRIDEGLVANAHSEARELERDLTKAFEAGCG